MARAASAVPARAGGGACEVADEVGAAAPDDAVFRLRLERFFPEFYEPLERLYGAHPAFEEQLELGIDTVSLLAKFVQPLNSR